MKEKKPKYPIIVILLVGVLAFCYSISIITGALGELKESRKQQELLQLIEGVQVSETESIIETLGYRDNSYNFDSRFDKPESRMILESKSRIYSQGSHEVYLLIVYDTVGNNTYMITHAYRGRDGINTSVTKLDK